MDFALTDDQKAIADLAKKICKDHLTGDRRVQLDAADDPFDEALWTKLADAGLLGVAVSEERGGGGQSLLELCALLAATGGSAVPLPLWAHSVAAMALDRFGDGSGLADAASGAVLLTVALTEPDGADPRAPVTTARAVGDGWILSGAKTCVPAAARAARILTCAVTDDGPALFVLDPASLAIEGQVATSGELQGLFPLVDTPAERLGGADAAGWLIDHATIALCATELGIAERVLHMTAKYTSTRVQFDRPIATFQAVSQRAADAYIDVEAIRLSTWQAAWRLERGLPATRELAVAKYWASLAGQRVTYAAQHLHGGIGFDLDYPLARYYPLSKQIELTLGGANRSLARLADCLANRG